MLAKRFPWLRTKSLLGLSAFALTAAVFGGGVLTGRAVGAPAAATPKATQATLSQNHGQSSGSSASVVKDNGLTGVGGSGSPDASAAMVMCPGDLPSGLLSGTNLDLAQSGLAPRLPGDGFVLQSINLRANGACGSGTAGSPVLDTQWRHAATGLEVWINQSVSETPVSDVITGTTASFSLHGNNFQVSVGGGGMIAVDGKPDASGASSGSSGASGPMIPAPDPHAQELLHTLLSSLAPSLSDACFAHQVTSGWDGFSNLGIGDPRPAIPSDWKNQHINIVTYTPPASDCGGAPFEGAGDFSATFLSPDGTSAIGMNVNLLSPSAPHPGSGFVSPYSVSWSSSRASYSVYMKSAQPDEQLLLAVAKALDPSLDVSKLKSESPPNKVEPAPAPDQSVPSGPVR